MLNLPRSKRSLWRESYAQANPIYPKLSKDISSDVAVIGGGITGLTVAYLLKQAGLSVAVLEKATVGGGTTGRTTGKVTTQHNLVYADLQKRLGNEIARAYAKANTLAFQKINYIIRTEKIDCAWRQEDNYVFTSNPSQVEKFRQEAGVASELGLPASFETTTPLPFAIQAAVKFSNQASFNSQQYVLGLASAIDGQESQVFENSNVNRIKHGKTGQVKTARGSVTARHIIVATNVPTLPLAARGTYCLMEYPQESYIVVGKMPKELAGMYISPDENHYSILPFNVNGENLVLVGGESHVSGLRGNTKHRYQRLADYAQEHFGVTEITNRWSDRDYLAYDGLPIAGNLYPWSDNIYVATAFKKWGLTNGTAAAMAVRDLIKGKESAWATICHPHRLTATTSIPRVFLRHVSGNG